MMYAQREVSAEMVQAQIADISRSAEPLGAYASGSDVRYLFLHAHGVECIATDARDAVLTSLAADTPLYDWHEREMRQKYDIAFDAIPDARPWFIEGDTAPKALTAEGKGVNVIVVGPVHAGVIEPGRFTFSTGGETTVHLDAQFSYAHRDIERACVGRNALELATLVARICGGCTVARSWAYARALEYLAGVTVDETADYARAALAELERVHNHIFDLANAASGAGYGRGLTIGLGLRERTLQLCLQASEHRLMFDAIVPGGLRAGILRDPQALRASLRELRSDVDRFTNELFENRSVVRRFEGSGRLDAETARLFGACGPARRASGGTLDVRRFAPYGAYDAIGVRVAVSNDGDVLARCSVKRDEIAESFRILDHALGALDGRSLPVPQMIELGRGRATTAVEGPRGTESVSVELDARGAIERLHVISASYRNWPVVARAMEGNIIPDFPLVNKSFNLCYSCMDR